jgi:Protein of unknown function (DUF3455)
MKLKVESPNKNAIPWLLIEPVETSGESFRQTKSVLRIDTDGGMAPSKATAANLGEERRVPYSASYRFYATSP